MDFGLAFSYPFQDQDWFKKIAIAAVIALFPVVGWFAVFGWVMVFLLSSLPFFGDLLWDCRCNFER
jgi:4-hydroxybenzoate polyprenyltransferase